MATSLKDNPLWFEQMFALCGEPQMPVDARDMLISNLEVLLREIIQVPCFPPLNPGTRLEIERICEFVQTPDDSERGC